MERKNLVLGKTKALVRIHQRQKTPSESKQKGSSGEVPQSYGPIGASATHGVRRSSRGQPCNISKQRTELKIVGIDFSQPVNNQRTEFFVTDRQFFQLLSHVVLLHSGKYN
jgi:hypothetical protein